MNIKEKSRQRTEKLFAEKLLPTVQAEMTSRNQALGVRQRLADEIDIYQRRIEAAIVTVREIQTKVDAEILKGEDTKKGLRELELKKAELQASERHLEDLTAQDIEATEKEKVLRKALAEAVKKALVGMRDEIKDKVEALLTEALSTMIAFEQGGIDICNQNGVDLGLEFEKEHLRLKDLDPLITDLSGYCSPVGQGESLAARRRLRREWLQE